jgi:hypothetical protein
MLERGDLVFDRYPMLLPCLSERRSSGSSIAESLNA